MASRWFCRVLGEELGPLGFSDLAEMVRAGTLRGEDCVRRELAREWVRADSVIGLFRDNDQEGSGEQGAESQQIALTVETAPQEQDAARAGTGRRWLALLRLSRMECAIVATGVAVVILLNAAPWLVSLRQAARFPRPELRRDRGVPQEVLAAVLGPPPKEPSVHGLQRAVPAPVPGLDRLLGITAVSLTADLKTIVFSAPGGAAGNDLFLASRQEVAEPFQQPVLIERCRSPLRQDAPAISPDGLLLVFVRYAPDPRLCFCMRTQRWTEFGSPAVWRIPELKPPRDRPGHPQFLDNERLVFAVTGASGGRLAYFEAKRAAYGFEAPTPFAAPGMPREARLSANRLRAYAGTSQGLTLAVRDEEHQDFMRGRPILAADVTGRITAPIWIAPQEDVVFYCSPGSGGARNSPPRLWMVRFH